MSCLIFSTTVFLFLSTTALSVTLKPDTLDAPDDVLFHAFQAKHKINFANDAIKTQRFNVFKQNMAKIRSLNAKKTGATFGINEFSAMSPDEFKQRLLPENFTLPNFTKPDDNHHWWHHHRRNRRQATPENFDWRAQNMITPVQNQGSCGSCWAFATVAAIEAHYAITHSGTQISLSEQNLVDCDSQNIGCKGGFMYQALEYARDTGLSSRMDYPYTAMTDTCKTNANGQKLKIDGLFQLPAGNEAAIKTFTFDKGPSIFSFKCPSSMQHYTGGIFSLTAQECSDQYIGGHEMVIVGYGVENGKKFWIAKNSWGTYWGENGYIRFERDIDFCNMTRYVMAPVINNATTTTSTTQLSTPTAGSFTTPTVTSMKPSTANPVTATTVQPVGNCPVCLPLHFPRNDSEVPKGFVYQKNMFACGSIKPMDINCNSEVSCYGTYASKNSYTDILTQQNSGGWAGRWTNGTQMNRQNYTCTSKGWIHSWYPDEPLLTPTVLCLADLPPNTQKHNCPNTQGTTTEPSA